eukprot:TRINITY_DN15993_c0_g1_i1.p1 TRINITY_DN15993_c0_g1~~TRINITY_DN15993_c0_g1_i1.p1  ORF type:complete len:541 (+),score=140.30 TRINITY_DN15993_c0_g1_i1:73-1695(+)
MQVSDVDRTAEALVTDALAAGTKEVGESIKVGEPSSLSAVVMEDGAKQNGDSGHHTSVISEDFNPPSPSASIQMHKPRGSLVIGADGCWHEASDPDFAKADDAIAAAARAEAAAAEAELAEVAEEEQEVFAEQELLANAEELQWLRHERALLMGDLGSVKAKFEITLETLRSILCLQPGVTWADILESTEALAHGKIGQRSLSSQGHPSQVSGAVDETSELLLQAERDLEEKEMQLEEKEQLLQEREQQLEERTARIRKLCQVLSKQQGILDKTNDHLADHKDLKDLVNRQQQQLLELSVDRDRFCEEASKLREEVQLREDRLHEKDGILAGLEAALAQKETELLSREEQIRFNLEEADRQRLEIEELYLTVTQREDELQYTKDQLEAYEAAERRHHSYRSANGSRMMSARSAGGASGHLFDDVSSEVGSSVSSARPSARGPGGPRYESAPSLGARPQSASTGHLRGRPLHQPAQPLATMDKDERTAFLSHFPMASRTERHMRTRIEDSGRRTSLASMTEGSVDRPEEEVHCASLTNSSR